MEYLSLIISYFGSNPYLVVLVGFLFIFFFFPLTEEAVLFIGGYLSSLNHGYSWLPTILAGIFGVFITDYWTYYLARKFGRKLLEKPLLKKIFPKSKQDQATCLVKKYGIWSILIVRFIPGGIRNPVFFIAGLFSFNRLKFILTALGGGILSTQISFWLGYLLHDNLPPLDVMIKQMQKYSKLFILGIVLLIIILVLIYKIRKKIIKNINKTC